VAMKMDRERESRPWRRDGIMAAQLLDERKSACWERGRENVLDQSTQIGREEEQIDNDSIGKTNAALKRV
jgi:hypothetical protein